MLGARHLFRRWGVVTLVVLIGGAAATATVVPANAPTVDQLKARVASANVGERPHLCVEIAEKQLAEADKLYAASEVEKSQAALGDVVAYSELARDYAIQSHKYQKQSEIAVRTMTRRLTEMMHTVSNEDEAAVRNAINHLQRVRDDLLKAMFPKGSK